MSKTTTNYGLVKPELTDAADITTMNPNWDKIDEELNDHITNDENPHNVTAEQVGSLKVYNSFKAMNSELGTSLGVTTPILDVISALPNNTGLKTEISASDTTIYPITYGVLSIYKIAENRVEIEYTSCVANKIWIGQYVDGTFGGFKEVFTENNIPTAENVGALPITGGTVSDEIVVSKNGTASVRVVNTSTSRRGTFQVDGKTAYLLNGDLDSSEYFGLSIDNTPTDLEEKLRFINKTAQDTRATIYTVFGTHNKNGGSYNGDGSATQRTIAVKGIGYLLVITSDIGTAWVSSRGAICLNRTTGAVNGLKSWECYIKDGVLTIATNSDLVNAANQTYWYDVL